MRAKRNIVGLVVANDPRHTAPNTVAGTIPSSSTNLALRLTKPTVRPTDIAIRTSRRTASSLPWVQATKRPTSLSHRHVLLIRVIGNDTVEHTNGSLELDSRCG